VCVPKVRFRVFRGKNSIIFKCETLDNYSFFIDKIREYQKQGLKLEKAINNAIEYCIENDILKKYLKKHGSEVFNMISSEWNWDTALEVAHEEGWEDGLEEGIVKGMVKEKLIIAKNLLAKGSTPEFVYEITGLSLDKIDELNP